MIWVLLRRFVEIECVYANFITTVESPPIRSYRIVVRDLHWFIFECGNLSTSARDVGERAEA